MYRMSVAIAVEREEGGGENGIGFSEAWRSRNLRKVLTQVDADWLAVCTKSGEPYPSPWLQRSLDRYQNVPKSVVEPGGISVVAESSARFPYGYSTYRELPRYGILIFEEYLNSFPHSACFLFPSSSLSRKKGVGRGRRTFVPPCVTLFPLPSVLPSFLLSFHSFLVPVALKEKKPIGRKPISLMHIDARRAKWVKNRHRSTFREAREVFSSFSSCRSPVFFSPVPLPKPERFDRFFSQFRSQFPPFASLSTSVFCQQLRANYVHLSFAKSNSLFRGFQISSNLFQIDFSFLAGVSEKRYFAVIDEVLSIIIPLQPSLLLKLSHANE